jgi:hypothetical protein
VTGSLPLLGAQALALDVVAARGQAPCAVLLASGSQNLQLGGGCTLHVAGAQVALPLATNAAGFATLQFPVPLDAGLRGGTAFGQGVVLDPLGAFAGLAFTGGLRLVVGD